MTNVNGHNRILVAVHFGEANESRIEVAEDSKEAVAQALDLATEMKSELTFAHVFAGREDPGASSDDGDLPMIHAEFDRIVAAASSRGITARWVFLFGNPSAEVCSLCSAEDFDLVVLGTRRRTGQGGSLIGSTAARVALTCSVPTWIVKYRDNDQRGVVAATDLTPLGAHVLRHGTQLARWRGVALHVVNACEVSAVAGGTECDHELRRRRTRLEAQMAGVVRHVPVPDFTSHVEVGSPESVIWSVAREAKADVVIVGLRDHDDGELLLRAHTATEVLTELPCSLLTVRFDEAE